MAAQNTLSASRLFGVQVNVINHHTVLKSLSAAATLTAHITALTALTTALRAGACTVP